MSKRFPTDGNTGSARGGSAHPVPAQTQLDNLIREARRLLANRSYQELIEKLEVHRTAEWIGMDVRGAKLLRLLSQGYLGQQNYSLAKDCLEQLRAEQQERTLLSLNEHAAILSELCRCYRELNLPELAEQCQEEAKRIQQRSD